MPRPVPSAITCRRADLAGHSSTRKVSVAVEIGNDECVSKRNRENALQNLREITDFMKILGSFSSRRVVA